jgi:hypothetical protein
MTKAKTYWISVSVRINSVEHSEFGFKAYNKELTQKIIDEMKALAFKITENYRNYLYSGFSSAREKKELSL